MLHSCRQSANACTAGAPSHNLQVNRLAKCPAPRGKCHATGWTSAGAVCALSTNAIEACQEKAKPAPEDTCETQQILRQRHLDANAPKSSSVHWPSRQDCNCHQMSRWFLGDAYIWAYCHPAYQAYPISIMICLEPASVNGMRCSPDASPAGYHAGLAAWA